MSDVSLDFRLLLSRIGYFRLVAGFLLLCACLVHFAASPRLDEEMQKLKQQAHVLRDVPVSSDQDSLLHDRHRAFLDRLPHLEDRPGILKALFETASTQGIVLPQAEYQLQHNDFGGYYRLRISVPASASYPKLRAFVDALLQQLPSASIDEIVLHRETVKNPVVNANLKLSIYFKDND
ncbi:MAG: hypothetical protein IV101_07685 [Dechloromonas sp.]|nr:hypothetical protein [Dechloromonas sp.]